MKLHLPVSLRKSVLACILATAGIFPSISISTASWGIAVCLLGSPSAKAEISTVTISSSGKSELISTPDDSLIIMNLNRGYLYGSSTLNSSFDVEADMQIDSLIISDGFKLNTYNFRGNISGSGTFERTSDAKGANQTYVFTGDMSQYSGDMKFSRENDGNTFKFIGNQSGTGHITIAAGNSIAVNGAVMNNSSITSAGTFTVSGNSSFAGDVSSTGTLNVNGSASFEGDVYSNGSLVLGADAMLTNKGSFTFGEEASINLVRAVAAEDAQRTLTYTILSSAGTGTSNLSSLSLERIVGIQSVGRNWSFNDDGTLVGVLNNHALIYAGGNLTWNTTTAAFSNGSETVAFTHGDDVTFSGNSSVTFGEALSAQRVTVANGAEVTISGGTGSLALAEAVVNGTLKLHKGGQNGAFSGNVDVYGTLSVETGDVTGWSGTDGIKSIDIFAGGEMYVGVSNNQTGAGLAINLQGGSISGVSGSNFDLGYGGAIYGYSSLSALAADTATAEAPTVSTISGTNLTLRQNHTTISVAENARLDISSGILIKGNKSDLNGEGAVPSHLQAGLVKTGAGELRLSGNNTYTQATTVAEGTLTLTGGASMASASVTVNDGAFLHLATGSGLSASVSGILSGNGTLRKTGPGSASIGGLSDSFAGHIELQQGTLSVASPVVISSGRELSLGMSGALLDSNLSLGDGTLSIDYSGSGATTSLNNSNLTLMGGTQLQLSSLGNGDGKTYELFSGISSLLGHDGSALSLNPANNAISNYFDTSQPGSGFWAGGSLQLTDSGTLQLVLHNEAVKNAITVTTRQSRGLNCQYFQSVSFKNLSYSGSSYSGSSDHAYGGAVLGNEVTLIHNGMVSFTGNEADSYVSRAFGGAIMGENITVSNNETVSFCQNSAYFSNSSSSNLVFGGAIHGVNITLSNNGSVIFLENTSKTSSSTTPVSYSGSNAYGGAIYVDEGGLATLSNNGAVNFSGNTAAGIHYADRPFGGAICGASHASMLFENNGSVSFGNNRAISYDQSQGGAIYGGEYGSIVLNNNGNVEFFDNTAYSTTSRSSCSAYGGAIYSTYYGSVSLNDNDRVSFVSNTAYAFGSSFADSFGGAICARDSGSINAVIMNNNRHVEFRKNKALYLCSPQGTTDGLSVYGGAIYGESAVTLNNNDCVEFFENEASSNCGANTATPSRYNSCGGAIYASGNVTLRSNGIVTFEDNSASSGYAYGGAIYVDEEGLATLSNNRAVNFNGNTASSFCQSGGGAIYAKTATTISMENNGSVSFRGNLSSSSTNSSYAIYAYGGAIYGDDIMLRDNGHLEFIENTVSSSAFVSHLAYGGAIYVLGSLDIRNNDSVVFSGNVEKINSSYRLRSIFALGIENSVINISAAAGNEVTFYDSLYAMCSMNLNEDYQDATGNPIKQHGDIIFSGTSTENDLYKAKGNVAGTDDEILASRTTEVSAMTNLYGGRLRVEDGAIYQGLGITVHEGSEATVRVKDAELRQVGYGVDYELEFNSGTTLEVAGNSTIRGFVNLKDGSLFKLEQAASLSLHETLEADAATLTVNGTALLSGSSTLNASLTLADGATLDMMSLDAGAVTLNGALTFGGQVEMGEHLMAILDEMHGWNESVTLFTGIESLVLPVTVNSEASSRVWVGDVFSNLVGYEQYYFNYVPDVGSLMVVYVPEPTTTTLGLLTLAGLALRRRRK